MGTFEGLKGTASESNIVGVVASRCSKILLDESEFSNLQNNLRSSRSSVTAGQPHSHLAEERGERTLSG